MKVFLFISCIRHNVRLIVNTAMTPENMDMYIALSPVRQHLDTKQRRCLQAQVVSELVCVACVTENVLAEVQKNKKSQEWRETESQ